MAYKKLELTKVAVKRGERQKWRKMVDGKFYFFRGAYAEALAQWHQKQAELTATTLPPITREDARRELESLACYLGDATVMLELDMDDAKPGHAVRVWQRLVRTGELDRIKASKNDGPISKTVKGVVAEFMTRQRAKMRSDAITPSRYDHLRRCLEHFVKCVGGNSLVEHINGQTIEAYHTDLIGKIGIGKDKWTPDTAIQYLVAAKQFVRWAWTTERLPNLPRNIDSKDISIQVPAKAVKTFSVDEIGVLMAHASERTKLYLLLCLNCGFTQVDVSDLKPDELDWERGYITRKRSKTTDVANAPKVSYPLWTETLRLLKKFGQRSGERVLLNEDGGPLRVEDVKEVNGTEKYSKTDNVASAYYRLIRKLKAKKLIAHKCLKQLRKTSPSMLESNSKYDHLARHFLGHSPRGVADKHYISPDQILFDEAVKWLGQQFNIEADLEKPETKPKEKPATKPRPKKAKTSVRPKG